MDCENQRLAISAAVFDLPDFINTGTRGAADLSQKWRECHE
jgi:hypothetical protein